MIASWNPIGYDELNAYGSVGANLRAIQSDIFFIIGIIGVDHANDGRVFLRDEDRAGE
jgi:hypothetical protein